MTTAETQTLTVLEHRIRILLPKEYQDSYQTMQPTPMGSTALKYDRNGRVAWGDIWGSFCDLAMAGGPPHKGKLLEAGRPEAVEAQPEQYDEVAEEICRGVRLAADIDAEPSPVPGWVRVLCVNDAMAGWLLRAIVMENVAVRKEAATIDLPAAPHFQLHKEIKNVVTVIAKTAHYWLGHIPRAQKRAIAGLFEEMAVESPLIEPGFAGDDGYETRRDTVAALVSRTTGLPTSSDRRYFGWVGIRCPGVTAAVWMMRALVASNVLSRREDTVLFVPVNAFTDPTGEIVAAAVDRVYRFAAAKGVVRPQALAHDQSARGGRSGSA
jgi:hypothetical protein